MFTIYLTENGHNGLFSATSALETLGTLAFRLIGPGKLVVNGLETAPGFIVTEIAYALLDAMHRYAAEAGFRIVFTCPEAKALNDQQIAQELHDLSLLHAEAA